MIRSPAEGIFRFVAHQLIPGADQVFIYLNGNYSGTPTSVNPYRALEPD